MLGGPNDCLRRIRFVFPVQARGSGLAGFSDGRQLRGMFCGRSERPRSDGHDSFEGDDLRGMYVGVRISKSNSVHYPTLSSPPSTRRLTKNNEF